MAVLSKVINTIQVADVNGNLSDEFPIGALASNIAVGNLQSTESVQDKINIYDSFKKTKKINISELEEFNKKLNDYINKNKGE